MRTRIVSPLGVRLPSPDRAVLPGTGMLLAGAASLLLWGAIAGLAAIL